MTLTLKTFQILMDSFHFDPPLHLAIAVSGGSDSMALALLTQDWMQEQNGKITALIVDHKLRPESTQEAHQTQSWLTQQGIDAVILTWENEKPKNRIQERARQARYDLLEGWCRANSVPNLLTAHQADDQWETMMQRLTRGSGPRGLRGILPERAFLGGRILRPFLVDQDGLGITKEQILKYLKEQNQPFIEDPSNQNTFYERVRWRQDRSSWESKGYTTDRILQEIKNATQTYNQLSAESQDWCQQNIIISPLGYLKLDRLGWDCLSGDLKSFLLQEILSFFQERPYPIPLPTLQTILNRLEKEPAVGSAGCYIVKRGPEILVTRETRNLPRMIVPNHPCTLQWDRFTLTLQDHSLAGWIVEPVGLKRAQSLCTNITPKEPSYVLAPLPCLVNPQTPDEILFPLIHPVNRSYPRTFI